MGTRPVHALAVDELGLRGQAAEGADGRGRPGGRSRVPVGIGVPSVATWPREAGPPRHRPRYQRGLVVGGGSSAASTTTRFGGSELTAALKSLPKSGTWTDGMPKASP